MIKRIEKRRRLLSFVLSFCLSIAIFGTLGASAATERAVRLPSGAVKTPIELNGREVLEEECFRVDGVTYVPLRNFCNLFGSPEITWNGSTNTATVKTDTLTLIAQTGNYYIYANGHYLYTVGKVLNLGGHLYVPIRPMALAFRAELTWNAAQSLVELTRETGSRAIAWASYNENDVYWLSRIISAEAKGEPFLGQIAVGNVVLNRVEAPSYPSTVYGVIFDRKYGTQFSPVAYGTIYQKPTASAVIAAKICLEGYTLSDSILYFQNPKLATSSWISRNRPYAFTIGNHRFYY